MLPLPDYRRYACTRSRAGCKDLARGDPWVAPTGAFLCVAVFAAESTCRGDPWVAPGRGRRAGLRIARSKYQLAERPRPRGMRSPAIGAVQLTSFARERYAQS